MLTKFMSVVRHVCVGLLQCTVKDFLSSSCDVTRLNFFLEQMTCNKLTIHNSRLSTKKLQQLGSTTYGAYCVWQPTAVTRPAAATGGDTSTLCSLLLGCKVWLYAHLVHPYITMQRIRNEVY
jgi:hypothetical protein